MRLRLAAIALAAAVGLAGSARTDDTTAATAGKPADVTKYVPEGAGYYAHINVRQFLAAPVVRKAIPMAFDKYGDKLMDLVQIAKAFDPNAANIPNEKIKSVIDDLKKPQTIAKAFDAAKDGLTDIVIAGVPGDDEKSLFIIKCHEAVTPDVVKTFLPFVQANPQLPIQIKTIEKGDKTIFEFQAPQQPQPFYFALPEAGVITIGMSKDLLEKAVAGGSTTGLKADLKKLVDQKKDTDFVFAALAGGKDTGDVLNGWGRLVLAKDITGDMSATFASPEKASEHAKEANENLKHFAEMVKNMLGPQGKDVAPVLDKMKAVASGPNMTAKLAIPGEVVEKLLAKDKD
jgi:hypothetical protein